MARIETIVYECDWCKGRAPAVYPRGEHYDDEPPKGWLHVDCSMLCPGCQNARGMAIEEARRVRHRMGPMGTARPNEGTATKEEP